MEVTSLLHKGLHLSGTDMSLFVWSTVSVFVLECSIKMKAVNLSTPITLYGTVPLGQICEMTLFYQGPVRSFAKAHHDQIEEGRK